MATESAANSFSEWLAYLGRVADAVGSGKSISLGPSKQPPVPPMVSGNESRGTSVLYCAPHPDDEALSGALALRLRLESSARVTDVAVTLGSGTAQHERRRREAASACRVLGFDLVIPSLTGLGSRFRGKDGAAITGSSAGSEPASGLGPVNLAARQADSKGWALRVQRLAEIFDHEQPDAVFAPHGDDFNTTHIGTYHLVTEALELHLSHRDASVIFIETEFWHEMAEPNLMVAVAPELAAVQLVAAAEHGGEMMRNPYHLLHPCRLMNNVRRGSEVVGGQGAAVQPFTFAELYRVSIRSGREVIKPLSGGHILPPSEKASLDWLRRQFPTKEASRIEPL
jgi:N-acetylglucosamine malate deacetylase 1